MSSLRMSIWVSHFFPLDPYYSSDPGPCTPPTLTVDATLTCLSAHLHLDYLIIPFIYFIACK